MRLRPCNMYVVFVLYATVNHCNILHIVHSVLGNKACGRVAYSLREECVAVFKMAPFSVYSALRSKVMHYIIGERVPFLFSL